MTRILIDMSPLKSGGRVQLAYNFLDQLKDADIGGNDFFTASPEFLSTEQMSNRTKQRI